MHCALKIATTMKNLKPCHRLRSTFLAREICFKVKLSVKTKAMKIDKKMMTKLEQPATREQFLNFLGISIVWLSRRNAY